jgi:2-polyprenyl-3-methyl-5-hydroxy-6-metoxy-1,4-benzoquinol methylase
MELMDRPQPVSSELESDLRNLRELNRYFGSYALIRRFLRRWVRPGDRLRVADLATASADIPRVAVEYARTIGAQLEVDALEQNRATVQIARRLSEPFPEIDVIQGDVFQWQPRQTYDLVLCTLVLHHFTEEGAVALLQKCRSCSRKYVLVSDLSRGLLATIGVHALTAWIFRDAMTRFDARLSAARAFSFAEMAELARRAGWRNFRHRRFHFARQAIWIE